MRQFTDTFYGSEDDERLTHTDIDSAIEEILDQLNPMPKTITVCKYKREVVKQNIDANLILESTIENLDERYGDSDGEPTDMTDAMLQAAKLFTKIIKKEYVPWTCEKVGTEEVDTYRWVVNNAPDWLSDITWQDEITQPN